MTVLLLCHGCGTVLISDQDDKMTVSFDHVWDDHVPLQAGWQDTEFTDLLQKPDALLEKP